MKKHTIRLLAFAGIALVGIFSAAGQARASEIMMFRDTFAGADTTDLNADHSGQSGTLAQMDWVERATGGDVIIYNGNLETRADTTSGTDGGVFWLDHNFLVNGATKSFTVTMRLLNGSSAGDGRAVGFGVGQSKSEVEATTASPSGDVFVGYDTIGSTTGMFVRHDGANYYLNSISGYAVTLSATFTFADMNAGSTLNYEVFNGTSSLGTGSTTWSGTDENYICFKSNYSGYSRVSWVQIDSTIPEPSTIVLLALAPLALRCRRRRR